MDIRTFFVTQDREKSTDSVKGAAALIQSVLASPPQPSTVVHTNSRDRCSMQLHRQFINIMQYMALTCCR